MLIIKPNKIKTFKNMQQYYYFIKWQMVGLISDIINRFTIRCLLLISSTCFPWGFYRERAKKNNALSRFLWTSTGVTFAIFVAAWMTQYGDIFHNHDRTLNTALNSIVERCRDFPSKAKKTKTASQNSTRREVSFTFSARWICMRLIIIMRSL